MKTTHKRHASLGAADLLATYLPPKHGRTPSERLQALAGKALTDGTPRIQHRLHTHLQPEERNDARSHLILAGIKATLTYNPALDQGTTNGIPLEIRFGRFAYLRMRQALIDWERKTYGDRRPGRTRHPDLLDIIQYHDELDPGHDPELDELTGTRDQIARWRAQAHNEGLTLAQWVPRALDRACDDRCAA